MQMGAISFPFLNSLPTRKPTERPSRMAKKSAGPTGDVSKSREEASNLRLRLDGSRATTTLSRQSERPELHWQLRVMGPTSYCYSTLHQPPAGPTPATEVPRSASFPEGPAQ